MEVNSYKESRFVTREKESIGVKVYVVMSCM